MGGLMFHPMKEIRMVVSGEDRPFVINLLDKVKAGGYTIISNISGKGRHGFRESHFMFNDTENLLMIMTVVPADKVEAILAGLRTLFERRSGVMLVSDVSVIRREHFASP